MKMFSSCTKYCSPKIFQGTSTKLRVFQRRTERDRCAALTQIDKSIEMEETVAVYRASGARCGRSRDVARCEKETVPLDSIH